MEQPKLEDNSDTPYHRLIARDIYEEDSYGVYLELQSKINNDESKSNEKNER